MKALKEKKYNNFHKGSPQVIIHIIEPDVWLSNNLHVFTVYFLITVLTIFIINIHAGHLTTPQLKQNFAINVILESSLYLPYNHYFS